MTCASYIDTFKGRILKEFSYATKLTGRGDDVVLYFDRQALGNKLVLCDYWVMPYHGREELTRFDNWRKPYKDWEKSFIGQRLIGVKQGSQLCLTFTNQVVLLANIKFVSIYNKDNECIFSTEHEYQKS